MSDPDHGIPSRAVLPAGTIIGGYRLAGQLGRGTTAVVFRADPVHGGPPVALKVALPGSLDDSTARARFERGARAQASLDHPNVVAVLDVGTDPVHGPWLAMALVEGSTLGALHAAGKLPVHRALGLLGQVAAGLDAAHEAGVVHRDVKPGNVLVDGDRALLADFGLARDGTGIAATQTGAVVGTLPYLAPELVHGAEPTAASDGYAFAAIAYEVLVGDVVFPRPTDAAVLYAHVDEPPPSASRRRPELPAAVDAVLAQGLAKDPARRPARASELVERLRRAIGDRDLAAPARRADTSAVTLAPVADAGRPSARTRLAILGVLATTGAAGAIAVIGTGDDSGPARAAGPPPLARGQVAIGSSLDVASDAIVGRDCRDRAADGSSPACTIVQTALPGRRIVVPRTGAIRSWAVAGASGELVLQVLRRRDNTIFQVFRSQPTVVPDRGVHRFRTSLPVNAGDVVGLAVLPGSQVGIVPAVRGARTERWTDPVSADRGPGTRAGFAHELLLRVDVEPGARIPPPPQVTGRAARALPAGREVSAGDTTLPDRRRVRVALVEADGKVYVDLFRGGIRRARCLVPDLVAGGTVVEFKPFRSPGNPSQLNVGWRNPGTTTDISHYFGLDAEAVEYYS